MFPRTQKNKEYFSTSKISYQKDLHSKVVTYPNISKQIFISTVKNVLTIK